MTHQLDLRGIACPMNFVKAKLFLDKLCVDECLTVILDSGEPVESVYASLSAEGHLLAKPEALPDGSFSLIVQKVNS